MPPVSDSHRGASTEWASASTGQRSCEACRSAKSACTREQPSCLRCNSRGISCIYFRRKRCGRPSKPNCNLSEQNHVPLPQVSQILDLSSTIDTENHYGAVPSLSDTQTSPSVASSTVTTQPSVNSTQINHIEINGDIKIEDNNHDMIDIHNIAQYDEAKAGFTPLTAQNEPDVPFHTTGFAVSEFGYLEPYRTTALQDTRRGTQCDIAVDGIPLTNNLPQLTPDILPPDSSNSGAIFFTEETLHGVVGDFEMQLPPRESTEDSAAQEQCVCQLAMMSLLSAREKKLKCCQKLGLVPLGNLQEMKNILEWAWDTYMGCSSCCNDYLANYILSATTNELLLECGEAT